MPIIQKTENNGYECAGNASMKHSNAVWSAILLF